MACLVDARLVCLKRDLSVRRQRACAAACASAFVWSTREAAPRVDMQSQLIGLDLRPDKVFVHSYSVSSFVFPLSNELSPSRGASIVGGGLLCCNHKLRGGD